MHSSHHRWAYRQQQNGVMWVSDGCCVIPLFLPLPPPTHHTHTHTDSERIIVFPATLVTSRENIIILNLLFVPRWGQISENVTVRRDLQLINSVVQYVCMLPTCRDECPLSLWSSAFDISQNTNARRREFSTTHLKGCERLKMAECTSHGAVN